MDEHLKIKVNSAHLMQGMAIFTSDKKVSQIFSSHSEGYVDQGGMSNKVNSNDLTKPTE